MTSSEKQEKLESLRAKAKDLQAEMGYIAMTRESMDARWSELKAALKDGAAEYAQVEKAAVEADVA